jgi:hypothetical protein
MLTVMWKGILPELSNFYCHPGKAGGSPFCNRKLKFFNCFIIKNIPKEVDFKKLLILKSWKSIPERLLGVIYHTLKNHWVFADFPNLVLAN